MLQMSWSGMRPSNPAIIVGGTPRLIDGEDLAVARAVIPLVVGEIRWLLAALLLDDRDRHAGLDRALRQVSVTGGAIGVVGALPGGDRLGRRCDRISRAGG